MSNLLATRRVGLRASRLAAVPVALLSVAFLAACNGDDDNAAPDPTAGPAADGTGGSDTGPQGATVTIAASRFPKQPIAVAVGATVTFTNSDSFAHTVTSAEGSAMAFDSGELTQDQSFEVTFDEAGEFAYFCAIHPTMRGTVDVA